MEDLVWVHLNEVLQRFADYFINQAKNNLFMDKSNASGALTNSFSYKVTVNDTDYKVEVNLEHYWYYVNNGRGAGKFPPLEKIKEWIKVKKIKPHVMTLKSGKQVLPTVEQLAFLIGRKIAYEGTEGTGFFDRAKEDTLNYFRESIELAITEDLQEYVINTLTPFYKQLGWMK